MNEPPITVHTENGREGLRSRSFIGLLLTQLLTAVNDNVFRWLVIGVGKDFVSAEEIRNILMAGTACFVLPYLLLAAPAGYLADRYSKRSVILGCKIAEIFIMVLGTIAVVLGNLWLLFVAVGLMGAQSALFSPAKLGSVPELLRSDRISLANALFGLTTVIATVVGMALGSWLAQVTGFRGQEHWHWSGITLISISIVGMLLSLLIRRVPAANPGRTFPWNAFSQTYRDLRTLASSGPLLRVALGIVFFWSVGGLAQLNIDQFASEGGGLVETDKVPLLFCLILGVGVGSILAGIWSGGRVELGILPLGAFGIAVSSMLIFTVQDTIIDPVSPWNPGMMWACFLLFSLGASAGLFNVPLAAFIQHRSPAKTRGSILAAVNFLTFAGVLIVSVVYSGMRRPHEPGTLDNIDSNLRGLPLTAVQQEQVEETRQRFSRDWQRDTEQKPVIQDYLPSRSAQGTTRDAEVQVYRATLTSLLWFEIKERQEVQQRLQEELQEETASVQQQFKQNQQELQQKNIRERFPESQQLVKRIFEQSNRQPFFSSRQVFLLAGILTLPIFIYIVWLIPQASVRFIVWLASRTVYRIRIHELQNLPEEGGALLVANHISWLDGILLVLVSSRPIRTIVYAGNFQSRWVRGLAKIFGVIMMTPRPKSIIQALQTARDALNNGELVCIFPEGGISHSGQIQTFKPGMMKILQGTEAPVIPAYLDGLWGSIFSFKGGKFFWKWPRKWPYPIHIHFGPAVHNPRDVHEVRQAVQDLGAIAVEQRTQQLSQLTRDFVRAAKRKKFRSKAADSLGGDLTGGALLMRSLILRRLLRREVLEADEQFVGLLLPPGTGPAVVNMALALDRRVAVNLNYTVSSEVLNACTQQCGIRRILTSRKVMEKMNFELDAEVVYLEDLRDKIKLTDKLAGMIGSYLVPAACLDRLLQLHKIKSDDILTVIFTSGSTGVPKGVMLTHGNVGSNIEAIDQVVKLRNDDVVLGVLPFFHSFGFTITLWTVMTTNAKGAYHFNPLDAKQVGKLSEKHGGTILLATPTFLRTYLRRCTPEQFAKLDVIVTGAEKLPLDLADGFEEKFGIRPVEGYGATELSPLASVNIPRNRSGGNFQVDCKDGTVGRPVPGVVAKVTDLDSGEELGTNEPGMLWIKGANVMKGYYGREDLTREAIQDGWYHTGDVALIDDDGFIQITGRMSRFSKIGGEMIPHIQIEETLNSLIIGGEVELLAAVTAVPDAKKGERLIVLHKPFQQSVQELCQQLSEKGLPNLYIPNPDSFFEVDEIPILGTGKLDLAAIKEKAAELAAAAKG
jgi:acyl-[acyl-carrier-protein]-phospholipid O-acyltransferase/long-chain-fatty-acid--[acyl-carrier-protein] ligase